MENGQHFVVVLSNTEATMREPDGDIDLGFENEDNQSPIDI